MQSPTSSDRRVDLIGGITYTPPSKVFKLLPLSELLLPSTTHLAVIDYYSYSFIITTQNLIWLNIGMAMNASIQIESFT